VPGGIRIPNLLILSFLLALLGEWVGTATQLWEKLGDLAGGRHAEASGLAEEWTCRLRAIETHRTEFAGTGRDGELAPSHER